MTKEHEFYNPIDPEKRYDRRDLIEHYENFSDMNEWVQTLQKDSENTGVQEDAGKLLRKNPFYYFNAKRSPRSDLEDALSQEHDNLGRYAKENSSALYRKLKSEDYAELIQKVPLYKTGNKEHDEFVETMDENRKMAEASGDPEKMAKYIGKRIKDFPTWAQISYMRHGENDLNLIFQSYANKANAKLKASMFDEKGKVKSEFLERVFRNSLREAKKEWKAEDYSEKEKQDVWKRNINPYYMALLEKAYEKEKKDEYVPQKKEDRGKRRKKRRAKGMPF